MQGTSCAFVLAFSTRFYGGVVMSHLMVPLIISKSAAGLASLLIFGLYIFDWSHWPSSNARRTALGVVVFFLLLAALAAAQKEPAVPIGLYVMGMPLVALGLGKVVLRQLSQQAALRVLAANFLFTFLCAFAAFAQGQLVYKGTAHEDRNKEAWLEAAGCATARATPFCTEASFLMWVAEPALGGVCFIYAVVLLLVAQSISRISPWAVARMAVAMKMQKGRLAALFSSAASARAASEKQKAVIATAKIVTAVFVVLFVAMYVAAAIAPAGTRLAHEVFALCLYAVSGTVLVLFVMFGAEQIKGVLDAQPLVRLALDAMRTDNAVAQAICVFLFTPLFLLYLALAAANQAVRRCVNARMGDRTYTKKLDASDAKLILTKMASEQLEHVRGWPWATVLLTVNYLGVAAWVLLYGSTLTYMGMAVMIAWLKTMHWMLASAMFFVVGIIMFLLPPVPGLAVYLTAGILLVPACEEPFGGEGNVHLNGFWYACIYAAFLAYLMKLVAQVMQQKGIGEVLGQSLYVRATVGVNSRLIKAIVCRSENRTPGLQISALSATQASSLISWQRLILQRKGFSLAKVSVLCGGPDWPTAVLCGILRADLAQMLLGLSPIFLLTVPTSMAGAFQLRVNEGDGWVTASSMMLLLAGGAQMLFGVLMLYFIEDVKTNQGDALEAFGDDAEVAAQEAADAKAQAAFERATEMGSMPVLAKAVLFVGTLAMSGSAYLLMFLSSECFEDFALTDQIEDVLCLDCQRAAIKPKGFLALGMLSVGVLCMIGFRQWAAARVKRQATAMV